MGSYGKYISTGGGRYPGVENDLLSSVTNGPVVRLVVVGHVRVDDKYCVRNSFIILKSDQS